VSARRATANSYFLTLHTALVAFVGVLSSARHVENSSVPKVDDFNPRDHRFRRMHSRRYLVAAACAATAT